MTQSVPGEIFIKAITVYNWPIQTHDFAGKKKKMLFLLPTRHTWKYLRSDVWPQFFLMEENKKIGSVLQGPHIDSWKCQVLMHGLANGPACAVICCAGAMHGID